MIFLWFLDFPFWCPYWLIEISYENMIWFVYHPTEFMLFEIHNIKQNMFNQLWSIWPGWFHLMAEKKIHWNRVMFTYCTLSIPKQHTETVIVTGFNYWSREKANIFLPRKQSLGVNRNRHVCQSVHICPTNLFNGFQGNFIWTLDTMWLINWLIVV